MYPKTVNRCHECGGLLALAKDSKELVCQQCGLIAEKVFNPETRVPMGETRSPTCSLDAFTSNLGSRPLNDKELYKISSEIYRNNKYPIRVLTRRWKHPIIEHMNFYGSKLMDKWLNPVYGRDSDVSHLFAEKLGKTIDRVGSILVLTNNGRKSRRMVEVAFLWVWLKMKLPNASKLRWGLWPKKGGIPEIREGFQMLSYTPIHDLR